MSLSTGSWRGTWLFQRRPAGRLFLVDNNTPTAAISYSVAGPYKIRRKCNDHGHLQRSHGGFARAADFAISAVSGGVGLDATDMTYVSSTQYSYLYTVGAGDGTATVSLSTGTDLGRKYCNLGANQRSRFHR